MNKLAIGITTYNNANNIENICNIYNISGISVYIVDDYSTDGTVELLKKEGIDCKLPSEKAGGPGAGRNIIIKEALAAENKFIAFIDGDDAAIIDNLSLLAKNINPKYDMYYTPMVVRGYNEALIPLGVSNYTYSGKFSTKKLESPQYEDLRFKLLLGSGGRVYNLDIIKKNNLAYDPSKSGQDTLFNHQYFACIKNVYFNDITKPYYIYDIQMNSLSNNYKLDVLNNRLTLIEEIAKYPFSIHTNKEYADKIFRRYTETYFIDEEAKIELSNILTKFVCDQYNYVPTNDYLKEVEVTSEFNKGINVILVDCNIEVPDHESLNVISVPAITNYEQLSKLLTHSKTIILDRSIYQVNFEYLLKFLEYEERVIQPKYMMINGQNTHCFDDELYHGFSTSGVSSTYTYVGMLYDTKLLLKFDFSFINHFELLVKSLFLNVVIPKIHNTTGFYIHARNLNKLYTSNINQTFQKSYFSNTRAKFIPYSKLAVNPIIKGSFVGVIPSYKSHNLSYEDHSFIETQLLEFCNFEGAYIVDANNNIIETTSKTNKINFSNMIFGKRVSSGISTLTHKKLINIPSKYKLTECKMIKFATLAVAVKNDYTKQNSCKSISFLKFDTEVIKVGNYHEYVKLIDENGLMFDNNCKTIPSGKYKFYIDETNVQYINKLNKVEFINKALYETENTQNMS